MNVVELKADRTGALESIDDLRAKIASGQVVAFAAVGIEKDDQTAMWIGSSEKKTRLQMIGAMCNIMLHYWSGDLK